MSFLVDVMMIVMTSGIRVLSEKSCSDLYVICNVQSLTVAFRSIANSDIFLEFADNATSADHTDATIASTTAR